MVERVSLSMLKINKMRDHFDLTATLPTAFNGYITAAASTHTCISTGSVVASSTLPTMECVYSSNMRIMYTDLCKRNTQLGVAQPWEDPTAVPRAGKNLDDVKHVFRHGKKGKDGVKHASYNLWNTVDAKDALRVKLGWNPHTDGRSISWEKLERKYHVPSSSLQNLACTICGVKSTGEIRALINADNVERWLARIDEWDMQGKVRTVIEPWL